MSSRSPWAAFPVKRKRVTRESGMSRATEHSRGEIVMDREEEVMVVDSDGTVTVVVVDKGTIMEHI